MDRMIKIHLIKTWVRELKPLGVFDYVISGIRSGVIQFVVDRRGAVKHPALCQNEAEDPANHNSDQNLFKKHLIYIESPKKYPKKLHTRRFRKQDNLWDPVLKERNLQQTPDAEDIWSRDKTFSWSIQEWACCVWTGTGTGWWRWHRSCNSGQLDQVQYVYWSVYVVS